MTTKRQTNGWRRHALLGILLVVAAASWYSRFRESLPPANLSELLTQEHISGAVLATKCPGVPVSSQAFGTISNASIGLEATTRFPLASLSKPITAAALRKLIKQGEISLDDKIFERLTRLAPESDARYTQITVRHLLQHTSGLNQLPDDPMFESGMPRGCQRAIDISLARPLESDPGITMRYSNTGYCLLGALIEDVTNMPYPDAVETLLGFPRSTSAITFGPPAPPVAREGWSLADDRWKELGAAGGWFGNAASLADFFAVDGQDPTILDATITSLHEDYYYGLGWRVWPVNDTYELTHFGSVLGAFSVAVVHPDGRASVLLLNDQPDNPEKAFLDIMRLLKRELACVPSQTATSNS